MIVNSNAIADIIATNYRLCYVAIACLFFIIKSAHYEADVRLNGADSIEHRLLMLFNSKLARYGKIFVTNSGQEFSPLIAHAVIKKFFKPIFCFS